MKRSEMLSDIVDVLENYAGNDCSPHLDVAELILSRIEEAGMLPPTNTCKLIPDELRGGVKHSPAKREWDE